MEGKKQDSELKEMSVLDHDNDFKKGLKNLIETVYRNDLPTIIGIELNKPCVVMSLEKHNKVVMPEYIINESDVYEELEKAMEQAFPLLASDDDVRN